MNYSNFDDVLCDTRLLHECIKLEVDEFLERKEHKRTVEEKEPKHVQFKEEANLTQIFEIEARGEPPISLSKSPAGNSKQSAQEKPNKKSIKPTTFKNFDEFIKIYGKSSGSKSTYCKLYRQKISKIIQKFGRSSKENAKVSGWDCVVKNAHRRNT